MEIIMKPIGYVATDVVEVPRTSEFSDLEGTITIEEAYREGLEDVESGQLIDVVFYFHKSVKFTDEYMKVKPPIRDRKYSVFNTHSPVRPNPIGISVLKVLRVDGNVIFVKGLDMLDGTPVLDIRPSEGTLKGNAST